ncbi:MAG: HAD hydrolase-like protein [Bacteroidetes bacterium]|nr:HAD hydrolase-like protein [Bacteroidota bacterium]
MDKPATYILDVDGVIFDSNHLKMENIRLAATPFVNSEKELDEFVSYFVSNNGSPREGKIELFFGKGSEKSEALLQSYNSINANNLKSVNFTEGAYEFIEKNFGKVELMALSGGLETEVRALFEEKGISKYFNKILGGPKTKKEHLSLEKPKGACVYFGDSRLDFESAQYIDARFVFIYGYTQFNNWQQYFADKKNVLMIKNLTEFNN